MSNSTVKAMELRDIVEKHITIDAGVATIDNKSIEAEAFERLGTTRADVSAAYDAVALTVNAIGLVFSEQAQDYLAEHKEVDIVTAKTKVADEKIKMSVPRVTYPNNPSTGEKLTVKGPLMMSRTIDTRGAEYTSIKQLAKERAIKTL